MLFCFIRIFNRDSQKIKQKPYYTVSVKIIVTTSEEDSYIYVMRKICT
jgi:hypothetical protein